MIVPDYLKDAIASDYESGVRSSNLFGRANSAETTISCDPPRQVSPREMRCRSVGGARWPLAFSSVLWLASP
jgi:hypothetical protein